MPIELRHLRYVIAASEQGSFRGAARVLGVRESAISRRIRDVELRLGAVLFYRKSSGVELTPAGELLLARARPAVAQLREVADAISSEERGVLYVGIPAVIGAGFLYTLLQKFRAIYRSAHPILIEGDGPTHIASVRSRRLDVAFIAGTINTAGCKVTPLWTERVFVALPIGHALAARRKIHPDDLREQCLLVGRQESESGVHGWLALKSAVTLKIKQCEIGHLTVMSSVALGGGVCLISEATTAMTFPDIVYRPLSGPGSTVPYNAVRLPDNDKPALRWLLSAARGLGKAHRRPS